MSGQVDLEAVHRRSSAARVAALALGLPVIVAGGLYDVIGWVVLGLLILFALTFIVPPVLLRLPIPAGWARSELFRLGFSGLLLAVVYYGIRGNIHPHWIGWGNLLRSLLLNR